MADTAQSAPAIRRLTIERFRSIASLTWLPKQGVNFILGGGDSGKTTILDAIALLLSPNNPAVVPDTDYFDRNVDGGFAIEAALAFPDDSAISHMLKPAWPWDWNGTEPVVPSVSEEQTTHNEPVYRLRVTATADLELIYEIVQPDGSTDSLTVALRRQIGLVRLGGDDRNDRDLRFVQGSALDRLLSDKALRSRLGTSLAETKVSKSLTTESKDALTQLDDAFRKKALPHDLDLAITGSPGLSVMALIGLTAQRNGVELPLTVWGSGTRRLSALAISEQNLGPAAITLVDEIERGLEPYRQRSLVRKLESAAAQVFATTHSLTAVGSASEGVALWYLDHKGNIGPLHDKKIAKHRQRDPAFLLARLTVVAEGATEFGFLSALLEWAAKAPPEDFGIHITDAGGNETALGLLEALAGAGTLFSGFADNEGKFSGRWAQVKAKLNDLLFQWESGCLDENVITLIPDDRLEAFIDDGAGRNGMRLRTLADRLGIADKSFAALKQAAGTNLKKVVVEAALGKVPAGKEAEKKQYEAHAQLWFKSNAGGRELAEKMFSFGIWPTLKPKLLPFVNAVRRAVDLDDVQDIVP
jgi:putative ATP-dependent endonuclease of OLD family